MTRVEVHTNDGGTRFGNSTVAPVRPHVFSCRKCHDEAEVTSMPRGNKVLRVGDQAPDFTLTDASTGEMVSLGDFLGRPLMIIFGRGTW